MRLFSNKNKNNMRIRIFGKILTKVKMIKEITSFNYKMSQEVEQKFKKEGLSSIKL